VRATNLLVKNSYENTVAVTLLNKQKPSQPEALIPSLNSHFILPVTHSAFHSKKTKTTTTKTLQYISYFLEYQKLLKVKTHIRLISVRYLST